jgi:ABC-type Mn2+/Zn2+ transport system permease subunit
VLELVTEPFSYGFMRTALAAGLLTVVASVPIGTWVVIRGLAFMGDALAHGVLPGIAVAYLLGLDLALGAGVGAILLVAIVATATSGRRVGEDTAIGLGFIGMLALGVTLISARGAYAGDLTAILFGDPIGVRPAQLSVIAGAAMLSVAVAALGHRAFLALAYDPAKARVLGLRPALAHVVMLTLIALVVVSAFRAVGTLLVMAFLIAPPATAVLVVRRVPFVMLVAAAFGSVAVVVGLLVSYHLGTATAATIAGLSVAGFFVVQAGQGLARDVRSRLASAA